MYTEFPISIRKRFVPYSHNEVSDLLKAMRQTFGTPGPTRRWIFKVPLDEHGANAWQIDFFFRDRNDSLIFCLKYLGEQYA